MDEIVKRPDTKTLPLIGEFLNPCKLLEGTGAIVGVRVLDVVGVQVDMTIIAVEVEVRRVGELALGVRSGTKIIPHAPEKQLDQH